MIFRSTIPLMIACSPVSSCDAWMPTSGRMEVPSCPPSIQTNLFPFTLPANCVKSWILTVWIKWKQGLWMNQIMQHHCSRVSTGYFIHESVNSQRFSSQTQSDNPIDRFPQMKLSCGWRTNHFRWLSVLYFSPNQACFEGVNTQSKHGLEFKCTVGYISEEDVVAI